MFGKFEFIGTKKFDGKADEVRFVDEGSDTIVYVDDDQDKVADMAILLKDGPAKLVEGDFVLRGLRRLVRSTFRPIYPDRGWRIRSSHPNLAEPACFLSGISSGRT